MAKRGGKRIAAAKSGYSPKHRLDRPFVGIPSFLRSKICTDLDALDAAIAIMGVPFDKTASLLSKVKGLVLVPVDRPDDCCGFGGTFCVTDEAVSARMGFDKVRDHIRHGAEYVVSPDMSCLMHQQGIARRAGLDLKYVHVAQVLNGGPF